MTSVTDICNLALIRARAEEIGDINEASAEAKKCRTLYPMAVKYLLSRHNWRFATTTRALAIATGKVSPEWRLVYGYPDDCVRALYVIPAGVAESALSGAAGPIYFEPVDYAVCVVDGVKAIGCSLDNAYLAYITSEFDLDTLSEGFKQALAWYLAADLAIPFGGDSGSTYRQTASQEYRVALDEATAFDANEAQRHHKRIPGNLAASGSSLGSHYYYNGAYYRRF